MVSRSTSLARLQIVVAVGVVASFLVASAVAAAHAAAIDRATAAIVGDALPSVRELSSARGDVHRLDSTVDDWLDGGPFGVGSPDRSLAEHIAALEASLSNYAALPFFPHEQSQFATARRAVDDQEEAARRACDALGRDDRGAALEALLDEQRSAARADDELERLVALNVTQADDLGRDIRDIRRSTHRIAMGLNGLAVALAAIATALAALKVGRGVAALQQAGDTAERRSTEFERFAGRVAHDILSPLTTVHLALSTMRKSAGGDDRTERAFERASRSLARVQRLVDGLLGYARAGAQPEAGVTADVHEVIQDVVDGARRNAEQHRVELAVVAPDHARVVTSVGVLTSLVANLVENAIKYMGDSRERVVTIRASSADDVVRVEVEDTGPGVPRGMDDAIFEPFVRGVSDANATGGVGLGLATVRQLVRAHGGALGVRSNPCAGSLFWFELPRATA